MKRICFNGVYWTVAFVDRNSSFLIDRSGRHTYGTTDISDKTVYIDNTLREPLLSKVLLHELTHCIIFSHNLCSTRDYEEFLCNFMADHSVELIRAAKTII